MNILLCELNKKEKKLRRYFLYLEPLKISSYILCSHFYIFFIRKKKYKYDYIYLKSHMTIFILNHISCAQ